MSRQKHIIDFLEKFRFQIEIILYVVLILAVVFVNKISSNYKYFGQYISFSHGLLLALFIALYISFTPGFKEAFEDLRMVARKQKKWYDEKVLKENPYLIENEKVKTQAVQST